MKTEEIWQKILNYFSSKLTNISFNTWFKDTKLISIDNNEFKIYITSEFKKNFIETKYSDLIDEGIKEVTGKDYTFSLVTEYNSSKKNEEEVKKVEEKNDIIVENKNINNNLNPNYTFDNFVVGDSNRLAQTVSLAVAESPGKLYNPLFLWGRSGLGKTHLMNAIGNYIVENTNLSVLYITSEQFINDFTEINRKKPGEDNFNLVKNFKDKYRNIDVLLIDDIQMLGNANKSQDEFFNTFNTLHGLNKQIIISSDRSPDDLKLLEERLRTRFTWGLPVNIMPPDYDLKLKILKNKIAGHETGKLIEHEVLEYIANNSESDVRHLEGAINRLYAYTAMYNNDKIDLDFAKEALKDYLNSSIYLSNDIAKIRKAVAEYYDLTEESLKSKKRTAVINNARQVAMYLCKMNTDETIEKIGLEFNRDHATVIHACDKVEEQLKTDEKLRNEIKEIKDKIIS